jgi:acyl-CoA dehydrogenase
VTTDFGLARAYAHMRTLRIADGPDEVHRRTIARLEFRKAAERKGLTRSRSS